MIRVAFIIGDYPPAERRLREESAKSYSTVRGRSRHHLGGTVAVRRPLAGRDPTGGALLPRRLSARRARGL